MKREPTPQDIARLRKRALSRERCEDIRRIARTLDGYDEALLDTVADYLLDIRQTLRGGRLDVYGSRHWPSE